MFDALDFAFTYTKIAHVHHLPGSQTFSRKVTCSSTYATAGRGAGMPWGGACDCTEATVIDAHRTRHQDAGREISDLSDLALAWALAQDKPAWVRLAQRLGRMATVIDRTDPEFAGELRLLSNVARRRAFMF